MGVIGWDDEVASRRRHRDGFPRRLKRATPELGAEPPAAISQAEAFFMIVGDGILRFVMITSTRLGAALSW